MHDFSWDVPFFLRQDLHNLRDEASLSLLIKLISINSGHPVGWADTCRRGGTCRFFCNSSHTKQAGRGLGGSKIFTWGSFKLTCRAAFLVIGLCSDSYCSSSSACFDQVLILSRYACSFSLEGSTLAQDISWCFNTGGNLLNMTVVVWGPNTERWRSIAASSSDPVLY